jgi:probable F420-dependent oxidoreductase
MTAASLERLHGTIGLWSFAHETLAATAAHRAPKLAEELGFASYWMPESAGRESFTSASLLLAGTSTITIGTSIASIWARDAMAAAAGAKTLNAAHADRFVLGLGVSHKPAVEQARGHIYERPVAAMRAYLEALDSAPMFSPEGSTRPPRLIAALGPAMLELAAELADGALPYLVTPAHTEVARQALGPDRSLVVEQAVALTDDEDDFRARASGHLRIYTGLPNYQKSWRRLGFSDEDFIPGGSHRLQDAMVVRGGTDQVAARVAEHREAGADVVCLQVLGADPLTIPETEWRLLAEEVR